VGVNPYRSTSSPLSFSMANLLMRLERCLKAWRRGGMISTRRILSEGKDLFAISLEP
jgi:hypothetical protein